MSVLVRVILHAIAERFVLQMSTDFVSGTTAITGAVLGALPFGALAAFWFVRKWPEDVHAGGHKDE